YLVIVRAVIKHDRPMQCSIGGRDGIVHGEQEVRGGIQATQVEIRRRAACNPRNGIPKLQQPYRGSSCPPQEEGSASSTDKGEVARLIDQYDSRHAKVIR